MNKKDVDNILNCDQVMIFIVKLYNYRRHWVQEENIHNSRRDGNYITLPVILYIYILSKLTVTILLNGNLYVKITVL